MARKNRRDRSSQETVDEAMRIARATQRPQQTKEQTKLIAQGVQKGIDHYKRQQKAKAREAEKRRRKSTSRPSVESVSPLSAQTPPQGARKRSGLLLPWMLLVCSWSGFVIYLLFFSK